MISHQEYKKFRSGQSNLPSNDQELAQFLVLDYFEAISASALSFEEARQAGIRAQQFLIKKYAPYQLFFHVLDYICLKWFYTKKKFTTSKKRILFQTSKHASLTLALRQKFDVGLITQGLKDRFFAMEHGMGWMGVNDLNYYIARYFQENNVLHLRRLMEVIEERLRKIQPDYIVLRGDGPPVERALVLASKKLGITTFVIQHGMYDDANPSVDEKVVDYALLWGNHFKDLFVKQNLREPEEMYVLGYPYLIEKSKNNDVITTVCYLGQDLEVYDKNFLPIKLEIISGIATMCKRLGLAFIYRPHPRDDREMLKEKLPGVEFTPKQEKLEDTFKKAEVFISFSSTALIEACMRSKISLQLINFPIKLDNFADLGASTASFNTLEQLQQYLSGIAGKNLSPDKVQFNNEYIETRSKASTRFIEIIADIEHQRYGKK